MPRHAVLALVVLTRHRVKLKAAIGEREQRWLYSTNPLAPVTSTRFIVVLRPSRARRRPARPHEPIDPHNRAWRPSRTMPRQPCRMWSYMIASARPR